MKVPNVGLAAALVLIAWVVLPEARAGDAEVGVEATVRPKRVALSDLKLNTPFEIRITYVLTNRTKQTEVINRFCTLRESIQTDDGTVLPIHDRGRDAAAKMSPADLLVVAPGEQVTLQYRAAFGKTKDGIGLGRFDESGEYLEADFVNTPKFIDISTTYANPLDRAAIEKMRPELKGTNYTLPEIKNPTVRVEIAG